MISLPPSSVGKQPTRAQSIWLLSPPKSHPARWMISLPPSSVGKQPTRAQSIWLLSPPKSHPTRWMISLPPFSVGSDPTAATLKRLKLDDVAEELATSGNGNGAG